MTTAADVAWRAATPIEPLIGFTLPTDHLGLLRQTNGAEGFGGYVRLFGFGAASAIDLLQWNAENLLTVHCAASLANLVAAIWATLPRESKLVSVVRRSAVVVSA
jgi:hypothetical protein